MNPNIFYRFPRLRALVAVTGAMGLFAGACTLLLDTDPEQCQTDGDCNARGGALVGATCGSDGICHPRTGVDGGPGTDPDSGGHNPDGGAGCIGPNGCWACAPETNEQILNACTTAECVPFDPARLAPALVDGGLPKLPPPPPPGDAGATAPVDAGGLVSCASLSNPVYVIGSAKPYVEELGKTLSISTPKTTLVHSVILSCAVVDAVLNNGTYDAIGSYWDPQTGSSSEKFCAVPAGTVPDIGISANFPTSCPGVTTVPPTVQDVPGPVQAVVTVVPAASTEKVISAEAAYAVYGFGAAAGIEPWTSEAVLYRRPPESGTVTIFGAAIGVPPTQMKGVPIDKNQDVVTKLTTSPDPARTLAILTTAFADQQRNVASVLAYQAQGQKCGYWPDSTPNSKDKKNIRDGHYSMWSGLHVLTRTTGLKPAASDVVAYLSGTREPPAGVKLFEVGASAGLIPACAMTVQRSSEQGPMSPFKPVKACGCRYEEAAGATPSCQKCTAAAECPASAPDCNYGFCERKL